MGAFAKWFPTHKARALARNSNLQEQPTVQREFTHGMIKIIGQIDTLIWPYRGTVRVAKNTLTQC